MRRCAKILLGLRALAALLLAQDPLQASEFSAEFGDAPPAVRLQPAAPADVAPFLSDDAGSLYTAESQDRLIAALRQKIKYVFVIYNENHSFDNEFGTFPGVDGIYSDGVKARSADETPGYVQTYVDKASGLTVTVKPFRIGPDQNSSFTDSVDHSHIGLARKINVDEHGVARMDGFARDEFLRFADRPATGEEAEKNQAKGRQFARLAMSHMDCETIPFLWRWASRFTIFDHIFATEDTPSTPNAIAMIAGQAGETQWVAHGVASQTFAAVSLPICGKFYRGGATSPAPILDDPQPFYGSPFDGNLSDRLPLGCAAPYRLGPFAANLTFASLPLSLLGGSAPETVKSDRNGPVDLADVQQDIAFLGAERRVPVQWRWYQEGFDREPNDPGPEASHKAYVSHHSGPQYFGYIANNPLMSANLRGLGDFFADVETKKLPDRGVIYIRGGFSNLQNLQPPIRKDDFPGPLNEADRATIAATRSGDDDHPGYSDRQISEALAARVINAVASRQDLWAQSAIVIAYDESDGFYDHVPPRILSYGPDKLPLSRGIRVPLILISPYARAHAVADAEGDHNAVIETINAIFGLPALANLPDEAAALKAGNSPAFNAFGPPGFKQMFLGPRDQPSPISQSLLSGFDLDRLEGRKPMLPASLALIPDEIVVRLPHYGDAPGGACAAIGVTPEDVRQGIGNDLPKNFNTLPATLPRFN